MTTAKKFLAEIMIVSLLTTSVVGAETPTASPSSSPSPSSSRSSSPTSRETPSSSPQKQIDVSKIVGKSDAEKILGESVRDPQPLNTSGPDGYYSKCNYYSSKSPRSLLVRVRQASPGSMDPEKELEQVASNGGTMQPVNGLGEKAAIFNGTPQNGLPPNVIMLYVVKGNAFITVGLGGIKDENTALEKAKGVVRKILAKL